MKRDSFLRGAVFFDIGAKNDQNNLKFEPFVGNGLKFMRVKYLV